MNASPAPVGSTASTGIAGTCAADFHQGAVGAEGDDHHRGAAREENTRCLLDLRQGGRRDPAQLLRLELVEHAQLGRGQQFLNRRSRRCRVEDRAHASGAGEAEGLQGGLNRYLQLADHDVRGPDHR